MSLALVALIVAGGWALVVGFFICLCVAAADADRASEFLARDFNRRQERRAACDLYSTTGRKTSAVTKKPPAAQRTLRGQTHPRGDADERCR